MKTSIRIVMILALLLAVSPVGANALTLYLDQVNTNNTGTQGPWASVTLTDSTYLDKDSVHFVVDPLESAFTSLGTNFGLQTFYFNENTTFGTSLRIGNFDPAGWQYRYDTFNAGGGFGRFEFLTFGNGGTRANPLSFDVYGLSGQALDIANFSTILSTEGYIFAAHIAGYGIDGDKSAKFATDGSAPVPEPGTIVLLGAGLLGLAIYGKRRQNKA